MSEIISSWWKSRINDTFFFFFWHNRTKQNLQRLRKGDSSMLIWRSLSIFRRIARNMKLTRFLKFVSITTTPSLLADWILFDQSQEDIPLNFLSISCRIYDSPLWWRRWKLEKCNRIVISNAAVSFSFVNTNSVHFAIYKSENSH